MKENVLSVSGELSQLVSSAKGSVLRVGGGHPMPASGVVWSEDGVVVTAGPVRERWDTEIGMPDHSVHPASLIGSDPVTGISLFRIEGGGSGAGDPAAAGPNSGGPALAGLSVPAWADPDSLEVGHLVLALGRPGKSLRASLGILTALGESWTTPGGARLDRYIQPDIALLPGFGGGPLVDMEGRFIGLNNSSLLRGVTLTVPYSTLRRVVETLLRHGRMRRGYLGVIAHPVRFPASLERDTGQDAGLVLLSVEEESPAEKAGLLIGDVLLSLNGEPVTDLEVLLTSLGETEPGAAVTLGIVRGGKAFELQATVGERE